MKKAPKLFAITSVLLVLLAMEGRAQSVCTDDAWTATSTTNAPSARYIQTMVWTGSEMIVWGGSDGSISLNTGGVYNVSTDTWRATSTTNAPTARQYHTAVWTGSEMIVWGGPSNTGGRYNPITDSWTPTSTVNAPGARFFHTALWTGSEMIVWGGGSNTGGRYNPSTDSWTRTSTINAPSARENHTAVWTGSEMIVWGGDDTTGGRYNPVTDSWTATSTTNAPAAREYHTAVWTGSEMIVWGGFAPFTGDMNSGGRYDPSTNSWTATSTTNARSARDGHTAVWTGTEMIVWGGDDGGHGIPKTGGRYNRGTDSWTATSTINAPPGGVYHTTVLTGTEMIVWGGLDDNLTLVSTGRRYCAQPRTPINVSGNISYCSNPVSGPVADVTFTLSGDSVGSTQSDGSGNYQFLALASGGTYLVTPSKPARTPGSAGINTMDVLATQRHFLGVGTPLSGCRLTAADVNGVGGVGTADVIAIQRFFLGMTTGISNAGKYQFIPASRAYLGLVGPQTGQNYDELILGDVAPGFVHRPSSPFDSAGQGSEDVEVPTTVATVALPVVTLDQFTSSFTAAVTTSAIDGKNKLVGFQGDFLFDERVVAFESDPVQRAGLTGGNWNVSGNVLDGVGPMRRLRISAYSNDFTPLSGSGTLFELRMPA